jgi:hypothetical protein
MKHHSGHQQLETLVAKQRATGKEILADGKKRDKRQKLFIWV